MGEIVVVILAIGAIVATIQYLVVMRRVDRER